MKAHWYLGLALGTWLLPGGATAKIHSNTMIDLPNGLLLADMNGDQIDEWVLLNGREIYVAETGVEAYGIAYTRLTGKAERGFNGRFTASAKEQACVIQANDKIACYELDAANENLVRQWLQTSFVGDGQEVVVGDFTGDGIDELLVYTVATGVIEFYDKGSSAFVKADPTRIELGDLGDAGMMKNRTLLAANFAQATGEGLRVDLVAYNPRGQRLKRFDARASGSKTTFEQVFVSDEDYVQSGESVSVANLRGGVVDDIVLHKPGTGDYRFVKAVTTFATMNLTLGDLPRGRAMHVFWGDLKEITSPYPADNLRDDALVFLDEIGTASDMFQILHARTQGGKNTWLDITSQRPLVLDEDPDGDGIETRYELGGYDPDKNGVTDEPLHSYGASPFVKDVFVEVDYMTKTGLSLRMADEAVNLAVEEMAKKGINLHILLDDAVAWNDAWGTAAVPFDWETHFDPIKDANFTPTRWPFFRYAVFGNQYYSKGYGSSGRARGIPSSDMIVTLGSWDTAGGTVEEQAGTLLHELGHTLGLNHGGEDSTNDKPNNISIMNYAFQTVGVQKDGVAQFLFSEVSCDEINEEAVNERDGIKCSTSGNYETFLPVTETWARINRGIDLNGDGSKQTIRYNLNGDKYVSGTGVYSVLTGGKNEYFSMVFTGGLVGQELPAGVSGVGSDKPRARLGVGLDPCDQALHGSLGDVVGVRRKRRSQRSHHGAANRGIDRSKVVDRRGARSIHAGPAVCRIGMERANAAPAPSSRSWQPTGARRPRNASPGVASKSRNPTATATSAYFLFNINQLDLTTTAVPNTEGHSEMTFTAFQNGAEIWSWEAVAHQGKKSVHGPIPKGAVVTKSKGELHVSNFWTTIPFQFAPGKTKANVKIVVKYRGKGERT